MFSLTSFKAALVHVLGIGEEEAHQFVAAIEADAKPMLGAFRQQVVADLAEAVTEGKTDIEALAKAVAAEVVKLLPAQATPPAAS